MISTGPKRRSEVALLSLKMFYEIFKFSMNIFFYLLTAKITPDGGFMGDIEYPILILLLRVKFIYPKWDIRLHYKKRFWQCLGHSFVRKHFETRKCAVWIVPVGSSSTEGGWLSTVSLMLCSSSSDKVLSGVFMRLEWDLVDTSGVCSGVATILVMSGESAWTDP